MARVRAARYPCRSGVPGGREAALAARLPGNDRAAKIAACLAGAGAPMPSPADRMGE